MYEREVPRGAVRCAATVNMFCGWLLSNKLERRSQSRPDSGRVFQVKVLETFQVVLSSFRSALACMPSIFTEQAAGCVAKKWTLH